MIQEKISLSSLVETNKSVVSCDLDGEVAMLNMDDGVYYGLNTVGASIWNLIQKPCKVQEVLDRILAEYEVERDQAREDLLNLLQKLEDKGLIEIK